MSHYDVVCSFLVFELNPQSAYISWIDVDYYLFFFYYGITGRYLDHIL